MKITKKELRLKFQKHTGLPFTDLHCRLSKEYSEWLENLIVNNEIDKLVLYGKHGQK